MSVGCLTERLGNTEQTVSCSFNPTSKLCYHKVHLYSSETCSFRSVHSGNRNEVHGCCWGRFPPAVSVCRLRFVWRQIWITVKWRSAARSSSKLSKNREAASIPTRLPTVVLLRFVFLFDFLLFFLVYQVFTRRDSDWTTDRFFFLIFLLFSYRFMASERARYDGRHANEVAFCRDIEGCCAHRVAGKRFHASESARLSFFLAVVVLCSFRSDVGVWTGNAASRTCVTFLFIWRQWRRICEYLRTWTKGASEWRITANRWRFSEILLVFFFTCFHRMTVELARRAAIFFSCQVQSLVASLRVFLRFFSSESHFRKIVSGFAGVDHILPGLHRVVVDSIGFLKGFTGYYWARQGYIGFIISEISRDQWLSGRRLSAKSCHCGGATYCIALFSRTVGEMSENVATTVRAETKKTRNGGK